ncbi:MAG: hypothetical protein JRJ85_04500, partial [Deltaproteobacteria bacterium]|nr:hypothetical protein [Deltaproteobacteria bacterium]
MEKHDSKKPVGLKGVHLLAERCISLYIPGAVLVFMGIFITLEIVARLI